jgi:hypothetical protein
MNAILPETSTTDIARSTLNRYTEALSADPDRAWANSVVHAMINPPEYHRHIRVVDSLIADLNACRAVRDVLGGVIVAGSATLAQHLGRDSTHRVA